MTPTDAITTLFAHNRWANLRLLEHCAMLTDEQLDASIPGAFGSIRDTLQHIVTSEQSYLSRISTGQPLHRSREAAPMTPAELLEAARQSGDGLCTWAPKVQAGDTVQIDWEGTMLAVPKTIILTQVINHATEHRAQVMAIMTQLGMAPPDLQGWAYFDELKG